LCYHQVAPASEVGRWLNVEPSTLGSHISFFRRRGYQFVRASEVPLSKRKSVCFTFDDAYKSTLTRGLEVLVKNNVTATFYAVPALVGQTSSWDGDKAKPLADWNQLLEARQKGFEIGNHTFTHARLSELAEEDQKREWKTADEILREKGYDPRSACYPYGDCPGVSQEFIRNLGYSCALSVDKWPGSADPMRRARLVIAYSDGTAKLLYRLYIRPHLP
jgi:peptidoglycan/xylan/chitin deacetylase (PgdA/CDA1 family)